MAQSRSLRFWTSVGIALVLTLAACSAAQPTPMPTPVPKANVTVSGSGSVASTIKFLAEAYGKKHSDLSFEFLSGSGTGGGTKGVLAQQLDLAAMARVSTSEESSAGMAFVSLGADRVALATSLDVSVAGLTSQQVKDILTGKITNWSAVGGPNATINVLVRDEADAATQILRDKLVGKEAFASGALVLTSAGDMNAALANTTNALGFGSYTNMVVDKAKARALTVDGHAPADVNDTGYPFTRQIGVGYLPANAKVKPFLDYIASPEAKTLLASVGVVTK
jgi:phosphate transport system substrate-binding protein